MLKVGLFLGIVLLVLIHIGLAYWYSKKWIMATPVASTNAHINNLRVTVQLILWVLPITVILLGVLGFGSIEDLRENIGKQIENELDAREITIGKIDKLYQEALQYVGYIKSIRDSLDLLHLPPGTIVAYYGDKKDIDVKLTKGYWAICDGKTHHGVKTPDLRDKFVLGKEWKWKAKRDSISSEQIHNQLTLEDTNQPIIINIPQGPGLRRITEIPRYRISTIEEGSNPLPPYFALVYLMKLK